MVEWIKTMSEGNEPMVRTKDSYPENRAKREGEIFLKNICKKCPFLSWGQYGLLDGYTCPHNSDHILR